MDVVRVGRVFERIVPVVLCRVGDRLVDAFDVTVALFAVPERLELVAFSPAAAVPLCEELFEVVGSGFGYLAV